jgi:hypothetical protein
MSLPSRLLGANPSIQVSTLLSGSLSTPSAKQSFIPPGDFQSIASITATGSTNSITFSSIPQTFKHLHIRGLIRNSANVGGDAAWMRVNGDTSASGYSTWKWQSFNNSGISSAQSTTDYSRYSTNTADTNSRANYFSPIVMDFPNYSQSSYQKTAHVTGSSVGPTSTTSYFSQTYAGVGIAQTAAITSITLGTWTVGRGTNFIQGKFELFGVAA